MAKGDTDVFNYIARGREARVVVGRKPGDQYLLRLPLGLRERLMARAAESGRSVSTEIIDAIVKHLDSATKLAELEQRIAALERKGK